MSELEFIELEIKYSQLKIDKAKKEKIYQETMALLVPENKNINLAVVNEIEISFNEYKIKQLEQIKIELEAWEVVKPSISKEHLEDCQIRIMYGENQFMNVSEEEATKVKKSIGGEDE